MAIINVHAAKTNLSRLIERACEGEEIVIARNNEPVVRLVPVQAARPRRRRGSLEGQVFVPDSFFEPLPEDDLESWGQ
jgi:prevent-host-death family protein